jgi:RNA polymerase sigma factor (sigma-70 family)
VSDIMDNRSIVERAAAGDQQAWDHLVREYGGRLRAIAAGFRLNRSDAEDAMQVTWMGLVANVRKLRSHDRIGAWLATTMRRNCLAIVNRRRRETLTDTLPTRTADETADVEKALITAESANLLWDAVGRLPPRQARLVRALFAAEERSYGEVACTLAMPVGAIGPTRQRALHRLAELLGEHGVAADELRSLAGSDHVSTSRLRSRPSRP